MKTIKDIFFQVQGKKRVLQIRPVMITLTSFLVVVVFLSALWPGPDTSTTPRDLHQANEGHNQSPPSSSAQEDIPHLEAYGERAREARETHSPRTSTSSKRALRPSVKIKYKAPQVILRQEDPSEKDKIPLGSNAIGKLLTSIDTRNSNQLYKVLMIYGMDFQGKVSIPKGSIIFGSASYDGQGEKVFMTFSKGVTPEGKEFAIKAQALSSKDYSPGIVAQTHGHPMGKMAPILGLSMVSEMANVLTSKRAIGRFGATVTRPSIKNAVMAGVSKATDMEAKRRSNEIAQEPPYATVDAGTDLIVSLTEGWAL